MKSCESFQCNVICNVYFYFHFLFIESMNHCSILFSKKSLWPLVFVDNICKPFDPMISQCTVRMISQYERSQFVFCRVWNQIQYSTHECCKQEFETTAKVCVCVRKGVVRVIATWRKEYASEVRLRNLNVKKWLWIIRYFPYFLALFQLFWDIIFCYSLSTKKNKIFFVQLIF